MFSFVIAIDVLMNDYIGYPGDPGGAGLRAKLQCRL
jgi:hypothetical protein